MNVSERLARSAVVPVVVLDDAKDAVATAKALLAGGVDVMEITFRKLPRHARRRGHRHHARAVQKSRRVRRKVHRCARL